MPSEPLPSSTVSAPDDPVLSALLHALNQPLTSLRCSLEMTLLQRRDSEQYRQSLRESLQLAEEISILANGIRELLDAEKAPELLQSFRFDSLMRETVRDFLPLAENEGTGLSLLCGPALTVVGTRHQLAKALLYLLEFALRSAHGGDVNIQAHADEAKVRIEIVCQRARPEVTAKAEPAIAAGTRAHLGFLIARRLFEVTGGTLESLQEQHQVVIRATLPHARDAGKNATGRGQRRKGTWEVSTSR